MKYNAFNLNISTDMDIPFLRHGHILIRIGRIAYNDFFRSYQQYNSPYSLFKAFSHSYDEISRSKPGFYPTAFSYV